MILFNASGAPELVCDECGSRWFDRMSDACRECRTAVSPEDLARYAHALETFRARVDVSPTAAGAEKVERSAD